MLFLQNRFICLFIATVVALTVSPASSGQSLPEHFSAFAVTIGGPRTPAGAGQVDITIERWSSEDEVSRLLDVLKQDGSAALLDALQDVKPVGTIRSPGSLGYDLRFAQHEDLGDGSRRIILATDRPMSFYETVNRPPSSDYPFTFVELRVNAEGRGEGKLALASDIAATPSGRVTIYNYDTTIQLNEVRRVDR
jgi:hypothetical protein